MPVVRDLSFLNLITNPYTVTEQMFDKYYEDNPLTWDSQVLQHCAAIIESGSPESRGLAMIPLLNTQENHQLKDGQLVRFRCMIQDMFDPELFLGLYHVKSLKNGEMSERSGLFRDMIHSQTFEEPLLDDKSNKIMERRVFYCISVPGENSWVKKTLPECRPYIFPTAAGSESPIESNKRRLDEEGLVDLNERPSSSSSIYPGGLNTNSSAEASLPCPLPDQVLLNFPLPNMLGQSKGCIVKVYDAERKLAINDVLELVGILSLDPLLPGQDRCEDSDPSVLGLGMESEEFKAHNPPTSLIPRLHVISLRKLDHLNPALPMSLPAFSNDLVEDGVKLKQFLVDLMMGDELSADYMLLNLISSVYSRVGGLPLGKLSVNFIVGLLSSLAESYEGFSALVYKVIESLVPKSFLLDLNLDSLNTLAFAPKKDYKANRLTSGVLQLSKGTILLIDDKVGAGQLTPAGIANLNALSILSSTQKVDFDFQFHKLEFQADIPIIALSQGPSILSCDVACPIRPQYDASSFCDAKNRINSLLEDHAFMTRMRNFLTISRAQESYLLGQPIQMMIQEEFVLSRGTPDQPGLTNDDLHFLLTMSRLLCQTLGKRSLDTETWQKARRMEQERKDRLKENRHN